MAEEFTSKITPCGQLVRATVFGPRGTSTKTCNTAAEAQEFISLVKAKKTWVRGRERRLGEVLQT